MSSGEPAVSPADAFSVSRKRQVSWFDTRQLLATGTQALAATIVGSMSGRREIMAALEPGGGAFFDHSAEDELWLDYIADTGDGWNATTSIAWLAGRDGLLVGRPGEEIEQPVPKDCFTEGLPRAGDGQTVLPGGRLLILGGDQVYPSASTEAYQQRFEDPFRCARYWEEPGRQLFAIPGNHDWYDGLTSFIRLFCQSPDARRWFGSWQAQQRRSYFSIRLPHRWWLWGLDMALEDDLDPPQLDYFRSQAGRIEPGDRLVLAVPTPSWLEHPDKPTDHEQLRSNRKLNLILKMVHGAGADAAAVLTGDLHFYARHQTAVADFRREYIVCGGGGAFGLGTLQVPGSVAVDRADGERLDGGLRSIFPDRAASRRLRLGVLRFPLINYAFSALLAGMQLVSLWLLSVAAPQNPVRTSAIQGTDGAEPANWIERLILSGVSFGDVCRMLLEAGERALNSPALLLWLLITFAGFVGFAVSRRPQSMARWKAGAIGTAHAIAQTAGAFLCVWLTAKAVSALATLGGADLTGSFAMLGTKWAILAIAGPLLYFYCGFAFGLYLLAAHVTAGMHNQELFSSQAIEDFKSFLRIHVTREALTIYPIGLRRSARLWKAAAGVTLTPPDVGVFSKDQKIAVPAGAQRVVDPCRPLAPHLIEEPIVIPGSVGP